MLTAKKKEFIEFMMSADVLRFGEFKTKSGRLTPYFVNTGNYKTGKQIATLGKFYAELIKETCGEEFDAMFGPAYKGIPLAAATAATLATEYDIDKPYFFNRKEVKDHGEGGSLVGYKPVDGDRVIIIEDVITAGTAIRETMPILLGSADVKVNDMFISVNRCEVGQNSEKTAIMEVKEEFGINVHSIISVADIYEYLKEQGTYGDVLENMKNYMDKYCIL
ncbi:orotate phosphoribosyltransferase [Tyzzerella sp. An114]|uniref:orotate phosphoribosyltransferase n=1 Tax=Tyzzerella sp. An114 TaxID=1965545 RepID=UPI000B43983B|nr:orotate phosphoribosyltransferase [Tyzzerella sp. An114]OUQ59649.1 orotate phosphoribosyltransferase [Tyzzerella sp. An114]HIT73538.1 orotate phosphoribosyltransferase [Candidatus Fimicola cottocaccae]